jgi:hypothetical protein
MNKILVLLIVFSFVTPLSAQEKIVFTGIPIIKISEGGMSRLPETLSKSKVIEYKCTITKIDNKYYWTTRENIELISISTRVFITFLGVNASGYIRIVKPEMREIVKELGPMTGDPEEKFDYVEHLLLGLKSVTYYGKAMLVLGLH